MTRDATMVASDLLLATRRDDASASATHLAELADMHPAQLREALDHDQARLAFWIDIYNAAVQLGPIDDLAGRIGRLRFFRRTAIVVAGHELSLDRIEHGILRRSHWKLGLGYASNPRPSSFERQQRVDVIDPRIHFALNCGATSCPPIAAYDVAEVDAQLEVATRGYLQQEVRMDGRTLRVPAVFLWFIGDFGGPPGIRGFLRDHGVDDHDKRMRFRPWDWTPRRGSWAPDDR